MSSAAPKPARTTEQPASRVPRGPRRDLAQLRHGQLRMLRYYRPF